MGSRIGVNAKVALGTTKILGIGTWTYTPPAAAEHDDGEFGDKFEKTKHGKKTGGQVTFDGLDRADDVTGQEALKQAWLNDTELTNLRLYEDNASYLEPNRTTGYFSPNLTTGAGTVLSHVKITAYSISAPQNDMVKVTFTGKVNGLMVEI